MGWARLVNHLHINFGVRSSVVSCYICPDDPFREKKTAASEEVTIYKFIDLIFHLMDYPCHSYKGLMSLILPYMNRLGSARHLTYTRGMRNPIGATR